jgi:prolyl-tRNA synthetase
LAIPVIAGKKTKSEQFPGADYTTTIEAMMQDGKALQSGTSHMLGQNFAKAFDVTFLDQESNRQYVWQTSWGLSTRIIGAIIMAHSDDKGLVLPPMIAPVQVAIIPVWGSEDEKVLVFEKTSAIASELEASGIRVKKDLRDGRPGPKFFDWEKRGVPLRIEIGPREIASGSIIVARRDTGNKEAVSSDGLVGSIQSLLQLVQADLYNKALAFRDDNTHEVNSYDEFKSVLDGKNGFLKAHWCGNEECEAKIKEETTATSRCIPFDQSEEAGNCIYCGKPSKERIIFAKAY